MKSVSRTCSRAGYCSVCFVFCREFYRSNFCLPSLFHVVVSRWIFQYLVGEKKKKKIPVTSRIYQFLPEKCGTPQDQTFFFFFFFLYKAKSSELITRLNYFFFFFLSFFLFFFFPLLERIYGQRNEVADFWMEEMMCHFSGTGVSLP